MAITTAQAKRDELVRAARLLNENLSRRAFGEQGPDLKVTLADLEQLLRPLVEAMAGGFLAVSAAEQSQRLAETLPCPTCGRECSRTEHERTLFADQGPFSSNAQPRSRRSLERLWPCNPNEPFAALRAIGCNQPRTYAQGGNILPHARMRSTKMRRSR